MSGGGLLSVGGWLAYQHGIYANLSATGKGIRIRYPQGVSSLADATLRLEGSQSNLLLSGNVLITRFTATADLDLSALAAQANAVQPYRARRALESRTAQCERCLVAAVELPERLCQAGRRCGPAPARHAGLAFAAGARLRDPGQCTDRRNALRAAARRITFTNPVRIEPVIDLTATAHVEDYDIYPRPARHAQQTGGDLSQRSAHAGGGRGVAAGAGPHRKPAAALHAAAGASAWPIPLPMRCWAARSTPR